MIEADTERVEAIAGRRAGVGTAHDDGGWARERDEQLRRLEHDGQAERAAIKRAGTREIDRAEREMVNACGLRRNRLRVHG